MKYSLRCETKVKTVVTETYGNYELQRNFAWFSNAASLSWIMQ